MFCWWILRVETQFVSPISAKSEAQYLPPPYPNQVTHLPNPPGPNPPTNPTQHPKILLCFFLKNPRETIGASGTRPHPLTFFFFPKSSNPRGDRTLEKNTPAAAPSKQRSQRQPATNPPLTVDQLVAAAQPNPPKTPLFFNIQPCRPPPHSLTPVPLSLPPCSSHSLSLLLPPPEKPSELAGNQQQPKRVEKGQ